MLYFKTGYTFIIGRKLSMQTKSQIQYQITELKMDYMNLQGDIEKLESTGHNDMVTKAEQRLSDMEARLAELNKQLAAL